jgi:S1-C subfamily serine protease
MDPETSEDGRRDAAVAPLRLRLFSGFGKRLLCLAALSLLPGCTLFWPTVEERAASFAPHAPANVEGTPIYDYVARRTAVLVGGMSPEAAAAVPLSSLATAMRAMHGRFAIGSATIIDRRGYLLTAAHCLVWQPLHVLFLDGATVRLARAQVVWHGDPQREGTDLALLAVDTALPEAFTWAADVPERGPVIGAGPKHERRGAHGLSCFSGEVVRATRHQNSAPPSTTVFHSSPVRVGDSGGPLLSVEGRLIAVNVGDTHELNVFRLRYHKAARAHRPDLDWLRERIERDLSDRGLQPEPGRQASGPWTSHSRR